MPRDAGVDIGDASAEALIAARTGDGVAAAVPIRPAAGPGIWEPTPPGFLSAATPWLGQMRPFTMRSPSQFLPDGPTSLSSAEWERDYTVTRILGQADSTEAHTQADRNRHLLDREHRAAVCALVH